MNKDAQHVHEFLKDHPAGVLSTVSEDGKPWGSTIFFVADEDFNFFFATRSGTLKYKNIANNPSVALTVGDKESLKTVQVSGEVSQVPADQAVDIVLNKLEKNTKPEDDYNWVPG